MYAVIETGGKQYRVAPGDVIEVETVAGDIGAEIELGRVLAVMNDSNELVTGSALSDARVKCTIAGRAAATRWLCSSSSARSSTSGPSDTGRTTRR